jgi:hypothetical protein
MRWLRPQIYLLAQVTATALPASERKTALLIALWYAISVVNNQSSKILVAALGAEVLTLNQLLLAAGCGAAVLRAQGVHSGSYLGFTSRAQLFDTAQLAAAFLAGCYTLNGCLARMHVSLAMTLRAAEPLTTLALGALMLPKSEQPPRRRILTLLPVVLGCALSAVGEHGPTAKALLLVGLSNVCFSLRGVLGKRVKATHGTGPVRLFAQMCVVGVALQIALLSRVALVPTARSKLLQAGLFALEHPLLLLTNGLSFYAQLQLSFVCLSRMSAVSHSLANSMRRPATVAAAILLAPAPLTPLNWAGVALACAGALAYGLL